MFKQEILNYLGLFLCINMKKEKRQPKGDPKKKDTKLNIYNISNTQNAWKYKSYMLNEYSKIKRTIILKKPNF